MSEKKIRVLTYNLHKGFSTNNRRFILHQIRDALLGTEADILFVQEIQGEHKVHEQEQHNWPACSHSEFLADTVWPHFAYGKNAVYSVGDHGNGLLSKYPIKQWENINVSPLTWASRSLLHGIINIPGLTQNLHIICIHLGLFSRERKHQFEILCRRIEEHVPHQAPLIIAGDFNDWMGQAEKLLYKHLELQEAFRLLHNRYARTFPVWLPFLQMDRIYFRGLEILQCERLSHAPWNRLSDHAPLYADFVLPH